MKVIWAIGNPTESELMSPALRFIDTLCKSATTEVFPVHFSEPEDAIGSFPVKVNFLNRVPLSQSRLHPAETLPWKGGDFRALEAYIEDKKADFVLASTHGRRGPSRIYFGSFAEDLLISGSIPLFIVNPTMNLSSTLDRVLVPISWDSSEIPLVESALHLCKSIGAMICFYHYLEGPKGSPETLESTRSLFQRIADFNGVKSQVIWEQTPSNFVDSILKQAGNGSNTLIALGSDPNLARALIRDAQVPVVVLPTSANSQYIEEPSSIRA